MKTPLFYSSWLVLALVACPSQQDSNPYAGGVTHPWQSQPSATALAFSPVNGDNPLSDLEYSSASSGWGPIEKDRSNGENQPGDGKPITIGGQVYPKGLGVHADSSLSYPLGGLCTRFAVEVGMDDEIDANPNRNGGGSVIFSVITDGTLKASSGVLRPTDAAKLIVVDVTGTRELRLEVRDAGDGSAWDHADWGNPRVTCTTSSSPPTPPPAPPATPPPAGDQPPLGYTRCASEGQHCAFTGTANVVYGARSTWTAARPFSGGTECSNAVFGDPIYGVAKSCYAQAVTSPPPAPPTPPPPAPPTPPAPPPTEAGFVNLFNGSDFTGWSGRGGAAIGNNWSVRQDNGKPVMHADDSAPAPRTEIFTTTKYGDFTLRLRWRNTSGGSGLYLRDQGLIVDFPGGNLFSPYGYPYSVNTTATGERTAELADGWTTWEVKSQADTITLSVLRANGAWVKLYDAAVTYTDPGVDARRVGAIGFQTGEGPTIADFADIRIKTQ